MNDGEGGKEQKDWPAARMSHVIGQAASGFQPVGVVSHVACTRALYTKTVVWLNYVVVARAGRLAGSSCRLRLVRFDRLSEPGDSFMRIGDFYDELFEALVLQGHDCRDTMIARPGWRTSVPRTLMLTNPKRAGDGD